MTLTLRTDFATAADRALQLAEEVKRQADAAGAPAAVTGLGTRPRAAYDRLVDALNRLPRPIMVLGSLALVLSALLAPDWFQSRMEALSRMPEALWWIIGAVVSLHFGARYQDRSHDLQREVVAQAVVAPVLPAAPVALPAAEASPGADAALVAGTLEPGPNPALTAWRAAQA